MQYMVPDEKKKIVDPELKHHLDEYRSMTPEAAQVFGVAGHKELQEKYDNKQLPEDMGDEDVKDVFAQSRVEHKVPTRSERAKDFANGYDKIAYNSVGDFAKSLMFSVPINIARGYASAVTNATELIPGTKEFTATMRDALGESKDTLSHMVKDIAQFTAAFGPMTTLAARTLPVLAGTPVGAAVAATAATFFAFRATDGSVVDLAKHAPWLYKILPDLLKGHPDDSQIQKRLRSLPSDFIMAYGGDKMLRALGNRIKAFRGFVASKRLRRKHDALNERVSSELKTHVAEAKKQKATHGNIVPKSKEELLAELKGRPRESLTEYEQMTLALPGQIVVDKKSVMSGKVKEVFDKATSKVREAINVHARQTQNKAFGLVKESAEALLEDVRLGNTSSHESFLGHIADYLELDHHVKDLSSSPRGMTYAGKQRGAKAANMLREAVKQFKDKEQNELAELLAKMVIGSGHKALAETNRLLSLGTRELTAEGCKYIMYYNMLSSTTTSAAAAVGTAFDMFVVKPIHKAFSAGASTLKRAISHRVLRRRLGRLKAGLSVEKVLQYKGDPRSLEKVLGRRLTAGEHEGLQALASTAASENVTAEKIASDIDNYFTRLALTKMHSGLYGYFTESFGRRPDTDIAEVGIHLRETAKVFMQVIERYRRLSKEGGRQAVDKITLAARESARMPEVDTRGSDPSLVIEALKARNGGSDTMMTAILKGIDYLRRKVYDPIRMFESIDDVAHAMILRSEVSAAAHSDALAHGLKHNSPSYKLHVDRFVSKTLFDIADPERMAHIAAKPVPNAAQQAATSAVQYAHEATFTGTPPKSTINNILNFIMREGPSKLDKIFGERLGIPVGTLIMPFRKTPLNMMIWALDRLPTSIFTRRSRAALAAGGREADEAVGRWGMGIGMTMAGFALAATGKVSTPGYGIKRERSAKEATGKSYNTILLDGRAYKLHYLAPYVSPIMAAAAVWEYFASNPALAQNPSVYDKAAAYLSAAGLGFGEIVGEFASMRGVQPILDALNSGNMSGIKRFLTSTAKSVTVPALFRQFTKQSQEHAQVVDGLAEEFWTAIGGGTIDKLDAFGKPIEKSSSLLTRYVKSDGLHRGIIGGIMSGLLPIESTAVLDTSTPEGRRRANILKASASAGSIIQKPDAKYGRVVLSPQEYNTLIQVLNGKDDFMRSNEDVYGSMLLDDEGNINESTAEQLLDKQEAARLGQVLESMMKDRKKMAMRYVIELHPELYEKIKEQADPELKAAKKLRASAATVALTKL